MKTLATFLTVSTLIAGVTAANADQQATDDAVDYALSLQIAVPSAYASARPHVGPAYVSHTGTDFQLEGR